MTARSQISWPAGLVADLARRRAVLVLGAGVSMNSVGKANERPKSWKAFLEEAIKKIPSPRALKSELRTLLTAGDYLTVCEAVRDALGVPGFHDLARAEFRDPGFKHARIHELIYELDSRIVITPNVDLIYENYVAGVQGTVALKTYRDNDLAEALRSSNRLVYKVHGTINTAGEMVFTRSDYAQARNQFRASGEVLQALVLTHTFLFLGCGLSDPDTSLLLEDYAFRHSFGRPHYFALPKASLGRKEIVSVFSRSRNLQFLPYDSAGGHVALTDSLEDLVKQVEAKRSDIQASADW